MSELQGIVEEIVFHNTDNGYVVAKINNGNEKITIVGVIPYITEGQNLKLQGQWVIHPQFGKQLKVESCEELIPESTAGIERYLSSGVITGIGPVTAKNRWKARWKTFEIIENDIERLKEIEGIGDKKYK